MHYRNAIVWQKAMQMAEKACRAAAGMPNRERFLIGNQLTRAAVSVVSNIAEGWGRESLREKAHFLAIAHGSLDEMQSQLELCRRLAWLEDAETAPVSAAAGEVGRILTALRRRLREAARPRRTGIS